MTETQLAGVGVRHVSVAGIAGKLLAGWVAARLMATPGRVRAGTVLIARGEFSIVIAALGAATVDGAELGALAAAYVLMTAVAGPLASKHANQLASVATRRRTAEAAPLPPV